jgi:HEAT repeat protein
LPNCLGDEDSTVVRAALAALAVQPQTPDFSTVESLLTAADSSVRVEAAVVLARHGSPGGVRSLLRLTHHIDPAVRRTAVQALGDIFAGSSSPAASNAVLANSDELRNQAIAELIGLLDDQSARGDALASLAKIVGDPPRSEMDRSEERQTASHPLNDAASLVRRWKQWHAARP